MTKVESSMQKQVVTFHRIVNRWIMPRKLRRVTGESSDTLAEVMRLCKYGISTDDVFIHCNEAAPEPMCVLATKQQLLDMERFCTGENFSILSPSTRCSTLAHFMSLLSHIAHWQCVLLMVNIHLFLDPFWSIRPKHFMRFTTLLLL